MKTNRIKELVDKLNEANKAYYQQANPIMSDYEYDKLYDELLALEKETDIILSNSPTQHVGYVVSTKWNKVKHEFPALSLDKTKDRNELVEWLGDKEAVLSWKEDGLTVVATYNEGKLNTLVTRGSGIEGEDITANAKYIHGIPIQIPYTGHLVVRGEALISYDSFERINEKLPVEEKYATPRNLASGTIRNLDSKVVYERNPEVIMFELVHIDDKELNIQYDKSLQLLSAFGFNVVEHILVNKDNLLKEISNFENKIKDNKYPSDGLVLALNDIAYGKSLGMTGKFPRHSIAFKWNDDTYMTKLLNIAWNSSRNSINPVAVFETVNIDGADISKASLHNVSIIEKLQLGIGDTIEVYLANKIIPQIAKNHTRSNTFEIPSVCPICGAPTSIVQEKDSKTLICTNENCPAKLLGKLELAVGKEGFNIDGLGTAQLQDFINMGWIKNVADIFNLYMHADTMKRIEGYGDKSVDKLINTIENAKHIELNKFIRALGIEGIGKTQSQLIANYCGNDENKFMNLLEDEFDWSVLDGIGAKKNEAIQEWVDDPYNWYMLEELIQNFEFIKEEKKASANLAGKTFVITGSLNYYENRNALKKAIESAGGKVSGSVSKNTTALICNATSGSTKSQKA